MTTEYEALILKKNSTKIRFDKKMANKYSEEYILTTKFYNISNYATILEPKKRDLKGMASIQLEGLSIKK